MSKETVENLKRFDESISAACKDFIDYVKSADPEHPIPPDLIKGWFMGATVAAEIIDGSEDPERAIKRIYSECETMLEALRVRHMMMAIFTKEGAPDGNPEDQ